jgi:hypothetical protein
VQDLGKLREGWDFAESENTRLLRDMTVQEGLQQWSRLQRAFEWQLQQTAELFEQERREALIELQARINRLAK